MLVVFLLTVGLVYFGCIDTQINGLFHDDGVYVSTAKALAEGRGYVLGHLVGTPPQLKYPIFYPAVLSVVWQVLPSFPENLWWLTAVSSTAALAALLLFYLYLRRVAAWPMWAALLPVGFTAGSAYFLFVMNATLSEGLFLLLTVLTVGLADWQQQTTQNTGEWSASQQRLWQGLLIILSALCFHTRTFGIVVLLAIGSYYMLNRQWKNAWRYTVGTSLLSWIPWAVWGFWHRHAYPREGGPPTQNYEPYLLELQHNLAEGGLLQAFQATLAQLVSSTSELMAPLVHNFFVLFPTPELSGNLWLVRGLLALDILLSYALAGYFMLRAVEAIRLKRWRIPGLYLGFYILLVWLWHYENQVMRFMLIALPWLWFYLLAPLVNGWSAKRYPRLAKSILILVSLASIVPIPQYVEGVQALRQQHQMDNGRNPWLWSEYQAAIGYIRRHIPTWVPVAARSDTLFGLYTGHRTFLLTNVALEKTGANQRFTPESARLTLERMIQHRVQALVLEPHLQNFDLVAPVESGAWFVVGCYPQHFSPIYQSPNHLITILQFHPKPKPTNQPNRKPYLELPWGRSTCPYEKMPAIQRAKAK
ncbi:MAG: hypothetical protein SFZ03_08640 [Candidatus Melainabacteria bacterium]|nr:hypothetical protein [Candidatus Melainabacteria bacterium]